MQDLSPVYVRFGSFTTDAVEATRACLPAFARKRTNGPRSWDVRFVPLAVIAAIRGKQVIWNIRPAFLDQSALMPANLITLANFSV
jgi:hypothetical protein